MNRLLRGLRMWWEPGSAGGMQFGLMLPIVPWSLRHELGGAGGVGQGQFTPWVMGSHLGLLNERDRLWFKRNPQQQG